MSGHPNVIQLLAFLETESHWCFVMEYADLGSLSQILRYRGELVALSALVNSSDLLLSDFIINFIIPLIPFRLQVISFVCPSNSCTSLSRCVHCSCGWLSA